MQNIGSSNKQLLHSAARWMSLAGFAALSVLVFVPSVQLELTAADVSQSFASGRVQHSLWTLAVYVATQSGSFDDLAESDGPEILLLLLPVLFLVCATVGVLLRFRAHSRFSRPVSIVAFFCGAVPVSVMILLVRLAREGVTAVFAPYLDRVAVSFGFTFAGRVLIAAVLLSSLLCLIDVYLCTVIRPRVGNLK